MWFLSKPLCLKVSNSTMQLVGRHLHSALINILHANWKTCVRFQQFIAKHIN